MKKYELENMITMIGCNKKEFMNIVNNSVGKVSMSSGSWYTPYDILDNEGILARYDTKGNLLFRK